MRVLTALVLTATFALGAPPTTTAAASEIDDLWGYSEQDEVQVGGEVRTGGEAATDTSPTPGTNQTAVWTPPPGIPPWVTPVERCVPNPENTITDCP